ncbi:hypothetical protein E2C01_089342 [Portunus trituberculatus]|uniref:Uncharacterized protein n=1 Tax=Portunus trituberculatus TaxID=210409 RepID=A0A5B7JIT1_PORTR|nr:hypothetical protein [Portunus trituberculatus]
MLLLPFALNSHQHIPYLYPFPCAASSTHNSLTASQRQRVSSPATTQHHSAAKSHTYFTSD